MKNVLVVMTMLMLLAGQGVAQMESAARREPRNAVLNSPISRGPVFLDSLMLDSIMIAFQRNQQVPGIASLVIKNSKIVWSRNYGYSNLQLQLPVEDSTFFLMASISKTILATAIMQLWEQGKIGLDGDINDYLPHGFRVANPYYPADKMTVRMLMTHTSSLDDNWNVLGHLWTCGDSPVRVDTFLINYFTPGGVYYSNRNFLNTRPGRRSNYCNAGSCLLALMVEHISGVSFDKYVRDSILTPLSMLRSSYFLAGMDTNEIAVPYMYHPAVAGCHTGFPFWPIGQLRTNKRELANFLSAYINDGLFGSRRILKKSTIDYMLSDHMGFVGPYGETQGLIWYTDTGPFENVWGHTGGWMGTTTYLFCNRQEKWGILFFINWATIDFNAGIYEYTTGDPIPEMEQYAHYQGYVYPLRPTLGRAYARRNIDSVLFQTGFANANNHAFTGHLIWSDVGGAMVDSLGLFDDGLHCDGGPHDGTYAAVIPPRNIEGVFSVSVSTLDGETGAYLKTHELCRFATAGPVRCAGYRHWELATDTVFVPGGSYPLRIGLRNVGAAVTIPNVTMRIHPLDPDQDVAPANVFSYGNIPSGDTICFPSTLTVIDLGADRTKNDTASFALDISSDGFLIWRDTINLIIQPSTDVKGLSVPTTFGLAHNYPNPFNPATAVRYQVPIAVRVRLVVYDMLGREVAVLMDERKEAGRYEVTWDASGYASGVYVCRMTAGDHVASKAMMLIK